MRISRAEVVGTSITLEVDPVDRAEAFRFAYGFNPGNYEIKKAKVKRSLDANAYAWVLIDKMAERLRMPKSDIYRNAIKEIGGNTETYKGRPDAIRKLAEEWKNKGLGWQAEIIECNGYSVVCLYYGSSSYDKHQMSVLIDRLVQDAQALGIETKSEEEIESLLESWNDK